MARKVFAATVMHETHTFSIAKTGLDDFKACEYLRDGDIPKELRGTRSEWGAVFDLADEYGWTLVHPVAASAQPAGPVTAEAFEHFCALIVDGLRAAMPVDGILLPLHGAMVAENFDDAEGEILRRVRAVAGTAVPIAVTLDLHANASAAMARLADIVTTYRTTPHVDMYETAERAGRLLEWTMRGEIRPTVSLARRPMLTGLDRGRTISGYGPMVDMLKLVKAAEASEPGVLDIGVNAGFAFADIPEVGPTVLVIGDGKDPRYQAIAERLIDEAWKTRATNTIGLLPMAEAIRIAKEPTNDPRPLLIGDYTDNPGGGGHGDGTAFLKAMIEAGVEDAAVGTIADPVSAQVGLKAGVGATVTVDLGGKADPRFGGGPLRLTGKVAAVSDGVFLRKGKFATGTKGNMGPSFLLDLGRIKVIVASVKTQIDDREQFRIYGIEPETTKILVCKAMNHFRADFEPIARKLIYMDSGGICSLNYGQFPWKKVPRPLWPLDAI
jgi:microcystin degradation protein MlrC